MAIDHEHMVVSMEIAKKMKVETVIECGVGEISALWFLDKVKFPDLKKN